MLRSPPHEAVTLRFKGDDWYSHFAGHLQRSGEDPAKKTVRREYRDDAAYARFPKPARNRARSDATHTVPDKQRFLTVVVAFENAISEPPQAGYLPRMAIHLLLNDKV